MDPTIYLGGPCLQVYTYQCIKGSFELVYFSRVGRTTVSFHVRTMHCWDVLYDAMVLLPGVTPPEQTHGPLPSRSFRRSSPSVPVPKCLVEISRRQ